MKGGLLAALCLAAISAEPAFAKPVDELIELTGKEPIVLRPDRAYFLFRTSSVISPVFLRVPTEAEMRAYDEARQAAFKKVESDLVVDREKAIAREDAAERAGQKSGREVPPVPSVENFNFVYGEVRNAQTIDLGDALEKSGKEKTFLIEAPPGKYVLYGLGSGDVFITCFCLGTVSFEAKLGQIADLGTLLVAPAANRSDIPELAGETGFGPSMNGHLVAWTAAIRLADPVGPRPTALAGRPVASADYRATGKFVAGFSFSVNRLAPLAGILGYDRGKVLDLIDDTVAPNQY